MKRDRRGILMRYTSLYQWLWLVLGVGGCVVIAYVMASLAMATGLRRMALIELLLPIVVSAVPLAIGLKVWRELQQTYREIYLDRTSGRVQARGLQWFRVVVLDAAHAGDVRFKIVPAAYRAGPAIAPRAPMHGFAVVAQIGAAAVPMAFVAIEREAAALLEDVVSEFSSSMKAR